MINNIGPILYILATSWPVFSVLCYTSTILETLKILVWYIDTKLLRFNVVIIESLLAKFIYQMSFE